MKTESNVSSRWLEGRRKIRPVLVLTGLAFAALLGGCRSTGSSDESSAPKIQSSSAALVSAAPSPVVPRSHHTLGLRNGLVYIIGGNPSATPSVEILDPNAETITAGPPLITNRRDQAMVTLPDGTFLVLGGIGSSGLLSSVERLNPGANAWQAAAPMPMALYGQSATVLEDGRVLVAGGVGYTTDAWLYDPSSDTWTATGSLALGRMKHGAVRLPDGRVLVAGGGTATASGTNTAELYDPSTGTWTSAGTMAIAPSNPQLTLITSGPRAGTVVVVGDGNSVEQYSPATGFSSLGPTVGNHFGGRALALPDGSVLLYGDNYGNLGIEQLGPSASAWTVVDSMPDSRDDAPGVVLPDGRALVVGGIAYPPGGGNEFARADAFYWSPSEQCVPTTCEAAGATCGTISDGCGGTLTCGTCGGGQTCDADNTCVAEDGGTCVPTTCEALGLACGTAPDGCGGTLTCGPDCSAGTVTATYDPTLKAPVCASEATTCSAVTTGRGPVGPEVNAPNTLGGTCADGTSGVFHSDESLDAVRVESTNGGVLSAGGSAKVEADVWAYDSSDFLDVFITTTPTAPVWTLVGTVQATGGGAQTLTLPLTLPSGPSGQYAVRAQFRFGGSATPCYSGSYNDRDDVVFAVEGGSDTTAPTTSVTNPASGSTVAGVVTFAASASDDVGVTHVDFFLDSTLIGSDTAAPFEVYWDTSSAAEGTHTLSTKAYDAAGNVGTSAPVSVNVVRDEAPPTVSLTRPLNGATVSGTVAITADASDDVGVTRVEFYVDGNPIVTDVAAPYSVEWDSAGVPSGPHTITAEAYDAANHSAKVSITVNVCGPDCSTGTVTATYDPTFKAPLCASAATTCSAVTTGRGSVGPEANAPNTIGGTCADGTAGTFHSDESLDAVRVLSTTGGPLSAGGSAQVQADVWAFNSSDALDVFITTTPASPVWTLVGSVQANASGAQTMSLPLTLPTGSGGQYAVRAQFRYLGSATPCASGSFNDRDDVVFAVEGGADGGTPDGGF